MSRRLATALASAYALTGCYRPAPPDGIACTTAMDCPAPLHCYGGRCLASPPDVDAPASVDAPELDAPSAKACPDSALQCDDFEGGSLGSWSILRSDNSTTVVLTDMIAHSGTHAVDASVPAKPGSGASAYIARVGPLQSTGMLALRAWIYSPGPIADFSSVLRFGRAGGYAMVSGDSQQRWAVTESSMAGLFDHHSTIATIQQRWTCVELDYAFAPVRIQLYIDDALAVDVTPHDPTPGFSEAGTGVTRAPTAGFRAFVDDVIVGGQHVGCQ